VFSELVLRKKNCSCIDAWRWDLEMLLPYSLMVAVIMVGILKLNGSTSGGGEEGVEGSGPCTSL